jgi:Tfp pilus assembly protein PilX
MPICRVQRPKMQGAITLLMVMLLVLLASMIGLFTARSVWTQQRVSNHSVWAVQTQLSAEAALETGLVLLENALSESQPALWDIHEPNQCASGYSGVQWQCRSLSVDADSHGHTLQVQLMRDVVRAPHVAVLRATARHAGNRTMAQVQQSVYMPTAAPIGSSSIASPLLTQGCVSEASAGNTRFCAPNANTGSCSGSGQNVGTAIHSLYAPDADGNGWISAAEQQSCLNVSPTSLQGGSVVTPTVAMPVPNPAQCDTGAWRRVFGALTHAQIQAISQAQALKGLSASTSPTRTVYWIDSASDWAQSVGSASAPVLLVFSATACASQCPRISLSAKIVGTVFLDSQCNDSRVANWHSGAISGQVAVASGLPQLQAGSQMQWLTQHRQAFDWAWPSGIDATRVQRVRGSWKSGF